MFVWNKLSSVRNSVDFVILNLCEIVMTLTIKSSFVLNVLFYFRRQIALLNVAKDDVDVCGYVLQFAIKSLILIIFGNFVIKPGFPGAVLNYN